MACEPVVAHVFQAFDSSALPEPEIHVKERLLSATTQRSYGRTIHQLCQSRVEYQYSIFICISFQSLFQYPSIRQSKASYHSDGEEKIGESKRKMALSCSLKLLPSQPQQLPANKASTVVKQRRIAAPPAQVVITLAFTTNPLLSLLGNSSEVDEKVAIANLVRFPPFLFVASHSQTLILSLRPDDALQNVDV
ncbi:hypothetical protein ACLOJK_032372 [Asimina triloba]